MSSSLLFSPYRSLGEVSSTTYPIPFVVQQLGGVSFVVLSLGRAFQVLRCDDSLNVAIASRPVVRPFAVMAAAAGSDSGIFTATGAIISRWERAVVVESFENRSSKEVAAAAGKEGEEDEEEEGAAMEKAKSKRNAQAKSKGNSELKAKAKRNAKSKSENEEEEEDEEENVTEKDDEEGYAKRMRENITQLLVIGGKEGKILVVNAGGEVRVWNTGAEGAKLEMEFQLPEDMLPPTVIMHPHTYLNKVVIAGGNAGKMQIWNIRSGKLVYTFKNPKWNSTVRCIEQSPAVDVVGIGLADGRIVLHNLRFDCEIAVFKHQIEAPSTSSDILAEAPAPISPAITSISFRSDFANLAASESTTNTPNMMVSSDETGLLAVWNLDEKTLVTTIPDCHEGAVSKVAFLPGEPLLLTCGARDNSLKMWIFDQNDGTPRLLRSREGHSAPPARIRFYPIGTVVSTVTTGADAACCQILSAGSDRSLRMFHIAREQLNREFSQRILKKRASTHGVEPSQNKLPIITCMAAMETKERDWCNIITSHRNESAAFMWNFDTRTLGRVMLRPDSEGSMKGIRTSQVLSDRLSATKLNQFSNTTSVAISLCGNFGFVGTESGTIFKYNMQSGVLRGRYPPEVAQINKKMKGLSEAEKRRVRARTYAPGSVMLMVEETEAKADDSTKSKKRQVETLGHVGAVTGLGVGALNRTLVSGGVDGIVRFWDLVNGSLLEALKIGSPISLLEMSRDSTICAIACDDFSLRVLDATSSFQVVRRFMNAHTHKITDIGFDGDSRLLFSSSLDSTLRVWDLPTAKCIDWLKFDEAATSLSMSPTGEYLATTHVDSVGIYLWASKIHFGKATADRLCREPIHVGMASSKETNEKAGNDEEETTTAPLSLTSDAQTTLSFSDTVSRSRWYTLAHLEIIKERNKPIEPPKKPESAPFFLPSLHAPPEILATTTAANDQGDSSVEKEETSRILKTKKKKNKNKEEEDVFQSQSHRSKLWQILEQSHAEVEATRANLMPSDDNDDEEETLAAAKRKVRMLSDIYLPFVKELSKLTPSAVDFELTLLSLGPEDEDGSRVIGVLLDWFTLELEAGTNFELVQAVINRLLALYVDSFTQREELREKLNRVRQAQRQSWQRLQNLFHHNTCLVRYFSHLQLS